VYIPDAFRQDDPAQVRRLMDEFPFSTLITVADDAPTASHVPLMFDPGRGPRGSLWGHLARNNPQTQALRDGAAAMAIFHGPHAYVSPVWYATTPSVPTWNYAAVHVYGRLRRLDGRDEIREVLAKLTARFEGDDGWRLDRVPGSTADAMIGAVVAFEIVVERVEGKWKMGQNRVRADREGAIAGLRATGRSAERETADWMEAQL